MKDIAGLISEYCVENDIYNLLDTEFGQNESFDKFRYAEQQYGMWVNILESGTYDLSASVNSRVVNHQRTIAITIVEKCVKEDKGETYYNQLVGVLSLQQNLFNYMAKMLDVTSASYETNVDFDDLNMVASTLTITFMDEFIVC